MDKNKLVVRGREEVIRALENLRIDLEYEPNKYRGPIFYTNNSGSKSPVYIRVKRTDGTKFFPRLSRLRSIDK